MLGSAAVTEAKAIDVRIPADRAARTADEDVDALRMPLLGYY